MKTFEKVLLNIVVPLVIGCGLVIFFGLVNKNIKRLTLIQDRIITQQQKVLTDIDSLGIYIENKQDNKICIYQKKLEEDTYTVNKLKCEYKRMVNSGFIAGTKASVVRGKQDHIDFNDKIIIQKEHQILLDKLSIERR